MTDRSVNYTTAVVSTWQGTRGKIFDAEESAAANVPPGYQAFSVAQFIKQEADKPAVALVLSQQVFGRPYYASPPAVVARAKELMKD